MSFDGFDEWDEKFLDQAIRLEEEVISSRNATQPAPAISPPPLHPRPNPPDAVSGDFSFSPPRELSQRPPETSFSEIDCEVVELQQRPPPRIGASRHFVTGGKEKEIERLKEHECLELKRDRDKKDEQLKHAFSKLEAKDAEIHSLEGRNVASETLTHSHPQMSLQPHCASTAVGQVGSGYPNLAPKNNPAPTWAREGTSKRLSRNSKNSLQHDSIQGVLMDGSSSASELKRRMLIDSAAVTSNGHPYQEIMFLEKSQPKFTRAIGIQTDAFKDYSDFTARHKISAEYDLSDKLLAIWDTTCNNRSERNLVSKCTGMSSKITLDTLVDENLSDKTLHCQMKSVQAVEAAKVSHLSDVLTNVSSGMLELDALFKALLDVCNLKNVAVVHRSLCILRVLLQHMLCFNKRPYSRDNVLVTSQNPSTLEEKKREDGVQFSVNKDETLFTLIAGSYNMENLDKGNEDFHNGASLSSMLWMSLFETMQQIVVGNTEQCLQVCINSTVRKFASAPAKGSWFACAEASCASSFPAVEFFLAPFLVHEVCISIRLSCPKLFRMFCTGHNLESLEEFDATENPPIFRANIMNGLADCLSGKGNSSEELELRRHAVIVVAFIASSGKSGFEVVLNSSSSKGICILELIVQMLASEMDVEAEEPAELHDICKGRDLSSAALSNILREGLDLRIIKFAAICRLNPSL
ncbi:hypothetical protein ACLOJK_033734 [Asimina triloba]